MVLVNPKFPHNVGGAVRACSNFDVFQCWWTGDRVEVGGKDGVEIDRVAIGRGRSRLPREERMKDYAKVQMFRHPFPLREFVQGTPVCIELWPGSEPLTTFEHPEDAIYVFGPEDGSVGKGMRVACHRFVHIPSRSCLNLAAAVNVVLYDRRAKRQAAGLEPVLPMTGMLRDGRGE